MDARWLIVLHLGSELHATTRDAMKIAVIRTGDPSAVLVARTKVREWEGYLDNARDIATALTNLGHEVVQLTDGVTVVEALQHERPRVAWVCSGGIQGRDPATHLPAILEMLGVRYVGSTPLAAGLADNKAMAKTVVAAAGVPTPDSVVVHPGEALSGTMTPPVIVKPVCGMCSCGVSRADTAEQLAAAVQALHSCHDDAVLVEQYVEGVDLTVAMVEQRGVLRCLPVLTRPFARRDDPVAADWPLPHPRSLMREGAASAASISRAQQAEVTHLAMASFRAIGLRHLARLDFRLSSDRLWFLEANHKPDLTRGSLMARSAALEGLGYHDLIAQLLANVPEQETSVRRDTNG